MSRIQIPLDLITSRLNLGERFQGLRAGPLSGRFSNLRPISEFFDFKRLSKPANFAEVQSRVNYNLGHFSSNYAVLFLMLSIYALLTNWLLLFDIIFVIGGMFLISKLDGRDLEIGTFKATTSQLWTGLLVVSIPIGLIASPFSTLLWLIGASGASILVSSNTRTLFSDLDMLIGSRVTQVSWTSLSMRLFPGRRSKWSAASSQICAPMGKTIAARAEGNKWGCCAIRRQGRRVGVGR